MKIARLPGYQAVKDSLQEIHHILQLSPDDATFKGSKATA